MLCALLLQAADAAHPQPAGVAWGQPIYQRSDPVWVGDAQRVFPGDKEWEGVPGAPDTIVRRWT